MAFKDCGGLVRDEVKECVLTSRLMLQYGEGVFPKNAGECDEGRDVEKIENGGMRRKCHDVRWGNIEVF